MLLMVLFKQESGHLISTFSQPLLIPLNYRLPALLRRPRVAEALAEAQARQRHSLQVPILAFLFPYLRQIYHCLHGFIHILYAYKFQFGMNGLFAGK